ncbi:UvrD-helicase domain-containing protein [Nocardia caishijiensis]|uniref:DNA 3'-5' helicase n=1 Tax=Nocardia caishijiensis TaxID=184756 RepID=A0ABQ6YKZ6_9NOCA|nr:UvrD-helicase domain-containing protein [Nocardia caishijiensis]KAF0846396.1 DNA helicase-2/ATP-dependent DNA helicase PcrA [Nocardia caishijiensis]
MSGVRVTPQRLADALGLPPPTDEQAAVIAAPPGPTLVVAGAGAGKTETMAARVVWMVANQLVAPDEVLGLTFTRKAAQQLTSRIRTRLARLAGAPLVREIDPSGALRTVIAGAEPEISTYHSYAGRLLTAHGLLLPVEPSAALLTQTQLWQLAHEVVRSWDGDLDTDRTPVSVTEAVLALSGQLAEHLVDPEELAEAHAELEKLVYTLPAGPRQRGGPSQKLQDVVNAQRERVELLPLVRQLAEALERRGALDFGSQMSLAARLAVDHPEVAAAERARFKLVLLDEYQDTGHAQRVLLSALFGNARAVQQNRSREPVRVREAAPPEHDMLWGGDAGSAGRSSQDERAGVDNHPAGIRSGAPGRERAETPVDGESGDLRGDVEPGDVIGGRAAGTALVGSGSEPAREAPGGEHGGGGSPLAVTAVGDPMQSIYGWRGASAANLPRFATDFPVGEGVPAPILPLLTSWRNPPEALALANLVADPLRSRARAAGGATVDALRAKPDAHAGTVELALTETVAQERDWVAERIAREWAQAREEERRPPPTSAVLIRRNADAAPLAEALREQGLPVEIVGLGGLLATPEVADIVATLRLIAEPGTGSAAVRILTGARWRIGVADLAALAERARMLSIGSLSGDASTAITDASGLASALREVAPEPTERAGLADAIADPGPAENYSEAGYTRILALGEELAALRERSGQPLVELVADVERTIGVGVETQTRRAIAGGGAGREHLDAFAEVVAGYAADSRASLSGLLAFFTAAESVENGLEPGEVEVARDRVQVLTVHAAKGLEWEVVAVPHVSASVFPSTTALSTWLGALTELPTTLRGDRAQPDAAEGVPVLDLSGARDRAELEQAIAEHREALKSRRLDEERRLFYVALTRTERVLLVSAYYWPETGTSQKGPSEFLLELKEADEDPDSPAFGVATIARWDDKPPADAVNPFADNPPTAQWPRDPLGDRRDPIEQGATLVREALDTLRDAPTEPEPDDDDPEGWADDVDALLAEFTAAELAEHQVELPGQLPATALVELRADPTRLAARLRRPLPYPPNPMARRGTAFHAWVQSWYGTDQLLGLDELPGAADSAGRADQELAAMQAAFRRSPWAHRNPVDVEVPFETSIAGTVIRGRMDAVFAEPGDRWIVVDWKTGAEPGPADEPAVAMQLAVYRLAWARLMSARTGEPEDTVLQRVSAAFHYVRSGRTIAPTNLAGPDELARLIHDAAPERQGTEEHDPH